jgi:hypothetical protein
MTRVRDEVGDISLLEGHRGEERQNEYFDSGVSEVRWPDGKHNKLPALAVDFRTYPFPTTEKRQFASLAYHASAAIMIGKEEGVTLRWGGDWNRNGDVSDQKFDDLFHIEIVETTSGPNEMDQGDLDSA